MSATETENVGLGQSEALTESQPSSRPISWMAILALLLGIASALVLVSSCFLWIPLAATLLGAAALWQTQDVEPVPIGRRAAWLGVFLGVFFAAGATTYQAVETARVESQVDTVLQQFLKYLRSGQLAKAHQLTREPLLRIAPEKVATEYSTDPTLAQRLESFKQDLTISFLASAQEVKVLESLTWGRLVEQDRELLTREYKLRVVDEEGRTKEVTLSVTFVRRLGSKGAGSWRIRVYEIPPEQMFGTG